METTGPPIRRDPNANAIDQSNNERVVAVDRYHDGINVMVAICTPSKQFKKQVQFSRSTDDDAVGGQGESQFFYSQGSILMMIRWPRILYDSGNRLRVDQVYYEFDDRPSSR